MNVLCVQSLPLILQGPGAMYDIRYSSEAHFKLRARENLFIQNIHFSYPITLKICPDHGSDTAILCTKFEKKHIQDFTKFEFWDR